MAARRRKLPKTRRLQQPTLPGARVLAEAPPRRVDEVTTAAVFLVLVAGTAARDVPIGLAVQSVRSPAKLKAAALPISKAVPLLGVLAAASQPSALVVALAPAIVAAPNLGHPAVQLPLRPEATAANRPLPNAASPLAVLAE